MACSTCSFRMRPAGIAILETGAGSDDDLLAALDDLLPRGTTAGGIVTGGRGHGRSHVMPALVPPYASVPRARRPAGDWGPGRASAWSPQRRQPGARGALLVPARVVISVSGGAGASSRRTRARDTRPSGRVTSAYAASTRARPATASSMQVARLRLVQAGHSPSTTRAGRSGPRTSAVQPAVGTTRSPPSPTRERARPSCRRRRRGRPAAAGRVRPAGPSPPAR